MLLGVMPRVIVARLASAVAAVFLTAAGPASAAQVESLTPSDRFTVADPAQLTGRRVALPLPNCIADPSGGRGDAAPRIDLDGERSVNPRIAIRFSAPTAVDTRDASKASSIVPLSPEPLPSPGGLAQLVWDAEHYTLYARPERGLLQNSPLRARRHRADEGSGRAPAPPRSSRAGRRGAEEIVTAGRAARGAASS